MTLANTIAEAKLKEIVAEYNKLQEGEKNEIIITVIDIIEQYKCSYAIAWSVMKLLERNLQKHQFNAIYQRGKLIIHLEK